MHFFENNVKRLVSYNKIELKLTENLSSLTPDAVEIAKATRQFDSRT